MPRIGKKIDKFIDYPLFLINNYYNLTCEIIYKKIRNDYYNPYYSINKVVKKYSTGLPYYKIQYNYLSVPIGYCWKEKRSNKRKNKSGKLYTKFYKDKQGYCGKINLYDKDKLSLNISWHTRRKYVTLEIIRKIILKKGIDFWENLA